MTLVELFPEDLAALGMAVGVLIAAGHSEQAGTVGAILGRMVTMETDEQGTDQPTEASEPEERVPDPQFTPPPVAPPLNRQEDFGSGPPPGGDF